MKRFSWYTDGKPHISTYLNGAPKKRYLVVDGIDVIGRAVMHYKPNMKGGHRHNQWKNATARMRKFPICDECLNDLREIINERRKPKVVEIGFNIPGSASPSEGGA